MLCAQPASARLSGQPPPCCMTCDCPTHAHPLPHLAHPLAQPSRRYSALLGAGNAPAPPPPPPCPTQQSAGFIDFDAVPDDGASVAEVVAFLLSPEARELRPLLVCACVFSMCRCWRWS